MDWTERMNHVMDYVEEHLRDEIKEEEISRMMGCSYQCFQTSFSQITNYSFSEYIRGRKLTSAAYELQNTDAKVIDIAMRYGYQSADAFRVAFKNLHGVVPSEVRKNGVKLTFYCKISFEINIKGVDRMDYTIIDREPFQVIGIRRTTPYSSGTWAIVKSDGSNEEVNELYGKFFDLGLCFGFKEDGSNDYMCGIEKEGNYPSTYDAFQYPAATWLKFEAVGTISGETLLKVWNHINHEFLPQSKYSKCGLPTIERYVEWNEAQDSCNVEVWIPVAYR